MEHDVIGLVLVHALQSLRASPGRAVVLLVGLTVALGMPVLTWSASMRAEQRTWARAIATPLVVGAPGSESDLVLAALGFQGSPARTIPFGSRTDLGAEGRATVVPLAIGTTAQGRPVVGTTGAYLQERGLELADGRVFTVLGEVVAGAAAARALDLQPGDRVLSDPQGRAELTGAMSTQLEVVGVLAPSGTPDDGALFTDVKTTWMLAGEVHGHAPVSSDQALEGSSEDAPEASLAVFMFTELTPETRADFHAHADPDSLPVSGLLLFPDDQRAHDQLLAELELRDDLRVSRPVEVVGRLLSLVARVRAGLTVFFALVLAATVVLVGAIVAQDWRLRASERRLMAAMGAPRGLVALTVLVELGLIGLVAGGAAAGLGWLGAWVVDVAMQGW